MTDEMMNLRTLLEMSSDADLLHEIVGFAAQRLMPIEVTERTAPRPGGRANENARRLGSDDLPLRRPGEFDYR